MKKLLPIFHLSVSLLAFSCDGKADEKTKPDTLETDTSAAGKVSPGSLSEVGYDTANNPYGLSKEPPKEAADAGTGRDILITISSSPDEKWKVCMALKLAEELAVDNNVQVYFDYAGVAVPLKETEDFEWRPFPPAKKQLERLMEMDAKVTVSRASLESMWKKPSDVMPGVKSIEMGDMLDFAKGNVTVLHY
jgi:predicted peroxiredoxin